jgi:hypothetical protein
MDGRDYSFVSHKLSDLIVASSNYALDTSRTVAFAIECFISC